MSAKLIIIRGNSGSGKTTVAKELRSRIGDGLSDNTMLAQQDVLRRDVLRERDLLEKHSVIELIELVVEQAKKYGPMLRKLASKFDEVYVYYFDLPFEETLVCHGWLNRLNPKSNRCTIGL